LIAAFGKFKTHYVHTCKQRQNLETPTYKSAAKESELCPL